MPYQDLLDARKTLEEENSRNTLSPANDSTPGTSGILSRPIWDARSSAAVESISRGGMGDASVVPVSPGTTGTEDFMKLDPVSSYNEQGQLKSVQVFGEQWDIDRLRRTTYGQDILDLMAANRKGRRGFGEAVADRALTKFLPFVNDITAVGFTIRDTIKTKATLQKLMDRVPLDDEEKIAARYFLAAQEREQMQNGWGKLGSVVSQAPAFALEFAITGGLGKLLLRSAAERALVDTGVSKTLKLLSLQPAKKIGKEVADEVAEETAEKLTLKSITKMGRDALTDRILRESTEEGADQLVIEGLRDVTSKRSLRLARPMLRGMTDDAAKDAAIKSARKQAAEEVASSAIHEAGLLTKGGRNRMMRYATQTYRESMSELLLGPGSTVPKTWSEGLGKWATIGAMSGPIGAARLTADEALHGIIALSMGEDHLVTPTELALTASGLAQQNQDLMDKAYQLSLGIRWMEYASESTGLGLTALGQGIAGSIKGTGMGRYLAGVGGRVTARTGNEEGQAVRSWLLASLTGREVADAAKMTTREAAETMVRGNMAKAGAAQLTGEALETAIQAEQKAVMKKLHVTAVGRALYSIMDRTGWGPKQVSNIITDVGYDGVIQEMYEERVNDFVTGVLGLNDRPDEFGMNRIKQSLADMFPAGQDLMVEAAAFALPALARKGMMSAQTQLMAGGFGKLNLLAQEMESARRVAEGGVVVATENIIPISNGKDSSVLVAQARVQEGMPGSAADKAAKFAQGETTPIDPNKNLNIDNVMGAPRRSLSILYEIGPMMTEIQSGTVSKVRWALSQGIGVINAMLNGSPALATYDPIAGALSRFDPELGMLAQQVGIIHQNLVKSRLQQISKTGESRADILASVQPRYEEIVYQNYRQFMANRGVIIISSGELVDNARQALAKAGKTNPTEEELTTAKQEFIESTRVLAANHMKAIKSYNYRTVVTGLPSHASKSMEQAAEYFLNVQNFSIEDEILETDITDREPNYLLGARELNRDRINEVAGEPDKSQMTAATMMLARDTGTPVETEGPESTAVEKVRENARAMAMADRKLHSFTTMVRDVKIGEKSYKQRVRIFAYTDDTGRKVYRAANLAGGAVREDTASYTDRAALIEAITGEGQEPASWREETHRIFLTPTQIRYTESASLMMEYLEQYAISRQSAVATPTYEEVIRHALGEDEASNRVTRLQRLKILKELSDLRASKADAPISDELLRRVKEAWGSSRYLNADGTIGKAELSEAASDQARVEKEAKEWLQAAGHFYGKVAATGRAAWAIAPAASNLNGDVYLSRTAVNAAAIVEDTIEALLHRNWGLIASSQMEGGQYREAVQSMIACVQRLLMDDNRWSEVVKMEPILAKHLATARSIFDPGAPSVEAISKLISAIVYDNHNSGNMGYPALGNIAKDVRSDPSYAPFLAVVEELLDGRADVITDGAGFHQIRETMRYWAPQKSQKDLVAGLQEKEREYLTQIRAAMGPDGSIAVMRNPTTQAWYQRRPWDQVARVNRLVNKVEVKPNPAAAKSRPNEVPPDPFINVPGGVSNNQPEAMSGSNKAPGSLDPTGENAEGLFGGPPGEDQIKHSLLMMRTDPNTMFGICRVAIAHVLYGRTIMPEPVKVFLDGLKKLGLQTNDLADIIKDPQAFLGVLGKVQAGEVADLVVNLLSNYDASLNLQHTNNEGQKLRQVFTLALEGVGVSDRVDDPGEADVGRTASERYEALVGSPAVQTFKLALQMFSRADRSTESMGTLIERLRRDATLFEAAEGEKQSLIASTLLPDVQLEKENVFSNDALYNKLLGMLGKQEEVSPRLYALGVTLQSLSRESGRRLLSLARHEMPAEGVITHAYPSSPGEAKSYFTSRKTTPPTGLYQSAVFDSVERQFRTFFDLVDGERPTMPVMRGRMVTRVAELRTVADIKVDKNMSWEEVLAQLKIIADIALGEDNLISQVTSEPVFVSDLMAITGRYSSRATKDEKYVEAWIKDRRGLAAEMKAMANYLADLYENLSPATSEAVARMERIYQKSTPEQMAATLGEFAARGATRVLADGSSTAFRKSLPVGRGSKMNHFLEYAYRRQGATTSSHVTTYDGITSVALQMGGQHQVVLDLAQSSWIPESERKHILRYGTFSDGTPVLVRSTLDTERAASEKNVNVDADGEVYSEEDDSLTGSREEMKYVPTLRRLYNAAYEHYDSVVNVIKDSPLRPRFIIVPFYAGESSPQGINIPVDVLQGIVGSDQLPETLDGLFPYLVQAIPFLQHPLKRQHSSGGVGVPEIAMSANARVGVILDPGYAVESPSQKTLKGEIYFNGYKNAKRVYKSHIVGRHTLLKGVERNARDLDTEIAKFVQGRSDDFVLSDNDGAKYTRLSLELHLAGKKPEPMMQLLFGLFKDRDAGLVSPEEIKAALGVPESGEVRIQFPGAPGAPLAMSFDEAFPGLEAEVVEIDGRMKLVLSTQEPDIRFMSAANLDASAVIGATTVHTNIINDAGARLAGSEGKEAQLAHDRFLQSLSDYQEIASQAYFATTQSPDMADSYRNQIASNLALHQPMLSMLVRIGALSPYDPAVAEASGQHQGAQFHGSQGVRHAGGRYTVGAPGTWSPASEQGEPVWKGTHKAFIDVVTLLGQPDTYNEFSYVFTAEEARWFGRQRRPTLVSSNLQGAWVRNAMLLNDDHEAFKDALTDKEKLGILEQRLMELNSLRGTPDRYLAYVREFIAPLLLNHDGATLFFDAAGKAIKDVNAIDGNSYLSMVSFEDLFFTDPKDENKVRVDRTAFYFDGDRKPDKAGKSRIVIGGTIHYASRTPSGNDAAGEISRLGLPSSTYTLVKKGRRNVVAADGTIQEIVAPAGTVITGLDNTRIPPSEEILISGKDADGDQDQNLAYHFNYETGIVTFNYSVSQAVTLIADDVKNGSRLNTSIYMRAIGARNSFMRAMMETHWNLSVQRNQTRDESGFKFTSDAVNSREVRYQFLWTGGRRPTVANAFDTMYFDARFGKKLAQDWSSTSHEAAFNAVMSDKDVRLTPDGTPIMSLLSRGSQTYTEFMRTFAPGKSDEDARRIMNAALHRPPDKISIYDLPALVRRTEEVQRAAEKCRGISVAFKRQLQAVASYNLWSIVRPGVKEPTQVQWAVLNDWLFRVANMTFDEEAEGKLSRAGFHPELMNVYHQMLLSRNWNSDAELQSFHDMWLAWVESPAAQEIIERGRHVKALQSAYEWIPYGETDPKKALADIRTGLLPMNDVNEKVISFDRILSVMSKYPKRPTEVLDLDAHVIKATNVLNTIFRTKDKYPPLIAAALERHRKAVAEVNNHYRGAPELARAMRYNDSVVEKILHLAEIEKDMKPWNIFSRPADERARSLQHALDVMASISCMDSTLRDKISELPSTKVLVRVIETAFLHHYRECQVNAGPEYNATRNNQWLLSMSPRVNDEMGADSTTLTSPILLRQGNIGDSAALAQLQNAAENLIHLPSITVEYKRTDEATRSVQKQTFTVTGADFLPLMMHYAVLTATRNVSFKPQYDSSIMAIMPLQDIQQFSHYRTMAGQSEGLPDGVIDHVLYLTKRLVQKEDKSGGTQEYFSDLPNETIDLRQVDGTFSVPGVETVPWRHGYRSGKNMSKYIDPMRLMEVQDKKPLGYYRKGFFEYTNPGGKTLPAFIPQYEASQVDVSSMLEFVKSSEVDGAATVVEGEASPRDSELKKAVKWLSDKVEIPQGRPVANIQEQRGYSLVMIPASVRSVLSVETLREALVGKQLRHGKLPRHERPSRVTEALSFLYPHFYNSQDDTAAELGTLRHKQFSEAIMNPDPTADYDDVVKSVRDLVLARYPKTEYEYFSEVEMSVDFLQGTADLVVRNQKTGVVEVVDYKKMKDSAAMRSDDKMLDFTEEDRRLAQAAIYKFMLQSLGYTVQDRVTIINYPDLAITGENPPATVTDSTMDKLSDQAQASVVTIVDSHLPRIVFTEETRNKAYDLLAKTSPASPLYERPPDSQQVEAAFQRSGVRSNLQKDQWYRDLYNLWKGLEKVNPTYSDPEQIKQYMQVADAVRKTLRERAGSTSNSATQTFIRVLIHTHSSAGRLARKPKDAAYGRQIGFQHKKIASAYHEMLREAKKDPHLTNEVIRLHTAWQVLEMTWSAVNTYGQKNGISALQQVLTGAEPSPEQVKVMEDQAQLAHPGSYDPYTGEEDHLFKKLSYLDYSQYLASAIMPMFHGINPRDIVQNREMEAIAVRYKAMAEFWDLYMGTADSQYLAEMEEISSGYIRDPATGEQRRLTKRERSMPDHRVRRMKRINSIQRIPNRLKLTEDQYDLLVMFSNAVRDNINGGNRYITGLQVFLGNFRDDARKEKFGRPSPRIFRDVKADEVQKLKDSGDVIPTLYVLLEQIDLALATPFRKLAREAMFNAASHATAELDRYVNNTDGGIDESKKAYLYEQLFLDQLEKSGWVQPRPGRSGATEVGTSELRDAVLSIPHDIIQQTFDNDVKLQQLLKDSNRDTDEFKIGQMAKDLSKEFVALQQEAIASAPYLMSSEAYQDLFQFRDPMPFIRGSGNYRFFNDTKMDRELMTTEDAISEYTKRLNESLKKENIHLPIRRISTVPVPRVKLFKDIMKELAPNLKDAQGTDTEVWHKMQNGTFERQGITEDSTIADLSIALHNLALIVIKNRSITLADTTRNPVQSADLPSQDKEQGTVTLGTAVQALRREAAANGWAMNLSGMTPEQIYSRHGLLSSNDTVADILAGHALQVASGLRKIGAVNALLMTKNEFGKPLVFAKPSDDDENTIVPEPMWQVLARWWAQSEGYEYNEALSGKKNAQLIFAELEKKSTPDSQMASSFKGNEATPNIAFHHIVKTNMRDIPSMLTRLNRQGSDQYSLTPYGDAAAWALHLISPPANQASTLISAAYDWSIQASKGVAMWGSAFHLNAVAIESGYAAGGTGYLMGLLADPKFSGVLDAAGKTAVGKALGINESLVSIWDMMRLARTNDPYFIDLKSFAAAVGLDFMDAKHNPIDVHKGSLRDTLRSLRRFAKESGADSPGVFSTIDKFLYAAQDDVQEWTFETVTNAVKLTIATNLMSKLRMRALQEGRWFDPMREMKRWSPYTNTEIGSIDPVMYPWAHPGALKWLRRGMFSWQWTAGAMEAAGLGALTHKITGFQLHPEVQAFMVPRWMRMFFGVMYGVPMAVQFALKAFSVAIGDDDPRDKWWIWNNPEGKEFDFNVDPLLRAMTRVPGSRWFHDNIPMLGPLVPGTWGDDPTLGNRQTYMHQGKQGWEIAGWFTNPKSNIFGKASLPIQRGWEIFLNESPGMDWDMPWRGKTWGSTYKDRIVHGMKMFVPFSVTSMARNKNAGILNMIGPVSKGASKTQIGDAIGNILYAWSQEDRYNELFSSPSLWSSTENLTRDWLNAGLVNGMGGELKSIVSGARGKIIRQLYQDVFAALPRSVDDPVNTPKLEAAMRALLRLDFTYANLMQSIETHRKGQSQKIRYTVDLTNIQDKAVRDAFWKGYHRKKAE